MKIYDAVGSVPPNALKKIAAGRLKGKSDINPMWRIKILTEMFGVCGIGWRYEITNQWLEPGANGEKSAFCNINLYVKSEGEWSEPIPGTGGSSFISSERNGLYTSDECFKMALTDAISVACKALGVAADVYWDSDKTKYSDTNEDQKSENLICSVCGKKVNGIKNPDGKVYSAKQVFDSFGGMCANCYKKLNEANK